MNKIIEVRIIEDELFPYYLINERHGYSTYFISEKLINEYNIAKKAFMKASARLKKAMEKST